MKILSWNVNGTFPPQGSPASIKEQIGWLESLESLPDVLLLQEVNPNRSGFWYESLRDRLGYQAVTDTLDLALELGNSNGHLTATRNNWELSRDNFLNDCSEKSSLENSGFGTAYPEKILVTDLDVGDSTIEVWNIRAVPGSSYPEEKLNILELVYDYIEKEGSKLRILAGDLNTPKRELPDGQAITYGYEREASIQRRAVTAELKILKGLGHFGMIDVFRAQHGYGDVEQLETSHDGRRIDHLFASLELSPTDCWYSPDGLNYSDHAPILAEFDFA